MQGELESCRSALSAAMQRRDVSAIRTNMQLRDHLLAQIKEEESRLEMEKASSPPPRAELPSDLVTANVLAPWISGADEGSLTQKFSACVAEWQAATSLAMPTEFFEAWLCLKNNAFLDNVMEGGLAADSEYTPSSWLGGNEDVDKHAVWIAIGDGTGGQLGLWDQNWEDSSKPRLLRPIFFDSEGCDNACLAPDFKSLLRIVAALPIEQEVGDWRDVMRCLQVPEIASNGELWSAEVLADCEPLKGEAAIAAVKTGHAKFRQFLQVP